jgi:lipid-binding SYLF domain-containing protein
MKHATLLTAAIFALGALSSLPSSSQAASAVEMDREANAALNALYASNATARVVGKKAKAILVFPRIIKGGFMVGGQHGDGALLVNGKTVGYFNAPPHLGSWARIWRHAHRNSKGSASEHSQSP